jgi:E3 SUMO-protein ligase PIAS1
MLFSAADNGGLNPYFENDIAFPHQVDLRVNLDDVKANLRGLKNKAGTTRPADITSWLRKIPKYSNEIRLTYALTHKVGIFLLICVQDSRFSSS